MTYPGVPEPVTFGVAHVDLCFFYDIDIVILVVEIFASDLSLTRVQDTMYRFGRAYPTTGRAIAGGHCLERAEWLDADGKVLSVSDYEQRDSYLETVGRYRAPRFAAHWEFLLKPLVHDHSDQKGVIRYRQIEYSRMPLLTYVAMDDARTLTRADFVRIGLVTAAGASDTLPFSERYVHDFEYKFCFDQFWNEQRSGLPGTRFMSCGHAFAMVGDAREEFFVDGDGGLLGQFRHQYFLLFLIPHFHKAALLMLSDRMVDALNKLDIRDAESVKRFKRIIRQLLEIFLRFTHRYWFHEVSDQPQAKELYRMTSQTLGTDRLYEEIREEIEDMSEYLESDTLRRQANTVVRLTVVTTFGLIGTVATGFLGNEPARDGRNAHCRPDHVLHPRAHRDRRHHVLYAGEVEAPFRFPRSDLRRAASRPAKRWARCSTSGAGSHAAAEGRAVFPYGTAGGIVSNDRSIPGHGEPTT
jgi:hypothetical protein